MSRPALFTYAGALRVLGRYERPVFDKADVALGGAVLAAGGDVLGLIDPKNEAMGSLRKALDGVSAKLTGLSGVDRQELVAAAHTVIAVVSVFEVYREHLGSRFDELGVTDREKFRALGVEPGDGRKEVHQLPALAALRVPAPGATKGFHENLRTDLVPFFVSARELVMDFISGLRIDVPKPPLAIEMRNRYVDHYLRLAAEVPEFQIWMLIGEHAATRTEVRGVGARVLDALSTQSSSMERLTRLLSLSTPGELPWDRAYRRKLENVAVAALAKPLLRTGSHTARTAFPTVERGFVAPAYRLAVHGDGCEPSSESWWHRNTEVNEDIDAFFAAHLASPDSTALPLLVLGHPGAGKSLLMSVLAARVPALGYAVVNVQLRKVDAEDSVVRQVETALEDVLSERVGWGRFADECGRNGIPVVLLDGFDELVQASGVTRSNYLQQVAGFQEQQADLGRPVAVVVTSRPLVVDRARIPVGTPVLKLEPFDEDRVDRWLEAWNEANASTPGFRPLGQDELRYHEELVGQPLLLLMLAIYAADPEHPRLDDRALSKAKLYERLIDSFVLRQARDKSREEPSHREVERRIRLSKTQLSVAALAMFNRGRQYVTAAELDKDLSAVVRAPEAPRRSTFDDPLSLADRTVEEFFFIHSAQLSRHGGRLRTYEFLHATFGEYLIAEVTLTLLRNTLAQERLRGSDPFGGDRPPADGLLFALVSHQVFTKRMAIFDFAIGLFEALGPDERAGLLDVLDTLVRSVHERAKRDEHPDYAPSSAHLVARVATYSANLVCLRVLLGGKQAPLGGFFPGDGDELAAWRSLVRLWQSGLDEDGWRSLLTTLTVVRRGEVRHVALRRQSTSAQYIDEAQLLDDPLLEVTALAGARFVGSNSSLDTDERALLDGVVQWVTMTSGLSGERSSLPWDENDLERILDEITAGVQLDNEAESCLIVALSREAWRLPRRVVARALHVLHDWWIYPFDFVSTACSHPDLLDEEKDVIDRVLSSGSTSPAIRLGMLVIAWLADRRERGGKAGLHHLVERLGKDVRESFPRHLDSVNMPAEVIEYFAEVDAGAWSFDRELFSALSTVGDVLLRKVEPHHFLALVERFTADDSPDDEDVLRFVERYLAERGDAPRAHDLPSALAALRDLVG